MRTVDRRYILVLIVIWFAVHGLLFQHYGIRSFYDSNEYLKEADLFVAGQRLDANRIFYSVFIGILSMFRWVFPNQIVVYIIFQLFLSCLAMLALYKASAKIFNNTSAGFFSALIFLLWLDNIHWNVAVMSESIMCSFICFLILVLSDFKNTASGYFKLILLAALILFTRPTGIIVIIGIISFLIFYHGNFIRQHIKLTMVIASMLVLLSYIAINFMSTHWDFTDQYKKGNIITYADVVQDTTFRREKLMIVNQNVEFASDDHNPVYKILYFIIHNPLYFLKTASLKIWYLLSFTRPYYSWMHNFVSLCWVSCVYVLFFVGSKICTKVPLSGFVLTVILVNCVLIAIATVDWDNRFYIPMEPGIVLLAGGGAAAALRRFETAFLPM